MINVEEELGKLVHRYNDNQKRIVAVRSCVRDVFAKGEELRRAASESILAFRVEETAYILDGGSKLIQHNYAADLPEMLRELQDALMEERDFQDALRKAGYEGLIR